VFVCVCVCVRSVCRMPDVYVCNVMYMHVCVMYVHVLCVCIHASVLVCACGDIVSIQIIHISQYTLKPTCTYAYMCVHMHTCTLIDTNMRASTHAHTHMHVCMYTCIHVHV
jgi:hypothetical protein